MKIKMSYSGSPNRSASTQEYMQQKLSKISLENDVNEERLCPTQDGRHLANENYEAYMEPTGSAWDYGTPQTRNLDTVVTDLTPEEVRWFYKCESEKRWLEFSGYDSLHIEMKFREMFDQLTLHSKFSAFSDQTSRPTGNNYFIGTTGYFKSSPVKFPVKQGNQYSQSSNRFGESQQFQHKIVVRGGLYDINFETWKCSSIYWPGEECQVTRGTWFYEGTWQPLDQEHSRVLESKHLSMFQGHKLNEFVDNETRGTVMYTETFPDFIVEWISPNQIYLYSENTPSKVVRTVTTRLGFRKSTGYRLFRGYKNEASWNDRPDVEINHLVFVIHGIGQKMDTGRIIRNTSSFRDCVSWLKQKYFSNFPNHRAEFFPVEWRSNLQLDADLVDAITPNTLQSLRQMLNASAMDIMYYTSPLYGGEVQRGLREELNRLYSMFSARNPYFMNKSGKISIIAHSLGCVILYDIIMGLKPGSLVQNNQQGLLFQVQNFFCLGSPLSVFLALRWKDSQIPGKMGVILPQRLCHRLYNVFHPTDPVAYRIEPLLVKGYTRIAPLVVQPYNANFRTPYSEMPIEIIVPEQQGPNDANSSNQSGNNKEECSPGGTPKDKSWSIWGLRNKGVKKSVDGTTEPLQEGLEYRLDYILRESNLGVSYLSALTSHTAYWTNYDVAYFVLTQLFPEFEKNDVSSSTEKSCTDRLKTYGQNIPPEYQYNCDLNNFKQSNNSGSSNPNSGNYASQNLDQERLGLQPQCQGMNFNQSPLFQKPNQEIDCREYPSSVTSVNYSQQIFPHQQPVGLPSQFQQPLKYQEECGPYPASQTNLNYPQMQQPRNYSPRPQSEMYPPMQENFPPGSQSHIYPSSVQSTFLPGQEPQSSHNYSQPHVYAQPHQQQFQQPQALPAQGYQQYQPQNYQSQQVCLNEQGSQLNFQQPMQSRNQQPMQPIKQPTSSAKIIPTKTGFFDKLTEDKKTQGAISPTKTTKSSFFPSFNLSSLTSPVKNLSNSLSSQMSNIGNTKDTVNSNTGSIQTRPPGGIIGNIDQSKSLPSNYQPQVNRTQSSQFNQGQYAQYQPLSSSPNQLLNQSHQLNIRSSSPYETQMCIRSGSPVSLQNRYSPLQYGPIETPVGAIKPKTIRLQPKIPNYEQKPQHSYEHMVVGSKAQCVSPLGQSRVVCSGSRGSLPGSFSNLSLSARSLSSGNLRNSTLVSGTYPGSRSNFNYLNQPSYLCKSGLDRKTMSRPNLSTTGTYSTSSLGMSSLIYSPFYSGNRSYLNREFSGPSSR